jgi:hypothetical protein
MSEEVDNNDEVDQSNYVLKKENKELCDVIKMVYKLMKKIYKLTPTFVISFMRIYNDINENKIV